MGNEIVDSLKDEMNKRLNSSFYGTYFIFWVIFHYKFIFALFFVSEGKIWDGTNMLKSDYLGKEFFNTSDWHFYIYWIIPLVFTWIFIKYFPQYITLPLFRTEQSFETQKKIIQIDEQRKLEIEETKLKKEIIKKTDEDIKKVQREKTVQELDPTISWKEEYDQFRRSIFYRKFNLIIDCIYKHKGEINIIEDYTNRVIFELPQDILVYSHANNLINLDKEAEKINLTEKGKFFIKQYSSNNRLNDRH